jgi:hypothetical protein
MTRPSTKIIITFIAVSMGACAVFVLSKSGRYSPVAAQSIEPDTVHTTAWYMAHPDIAKQDEARCGNDAASISEAACQNEASAENLLLENELRNAAAANSAAAKDQTSQ